MSGTSATLADLFAFSYSTPDPHFAFTLSIRQLCTCIQNSRLETSARVSLLMRFKRLGGFRHEFLLLKISLMPDEGVSIWLRLDRGPKLDGPTPGSSISLFPACDSVVISPSEVPLLCGVRYQREAEVIFPIDKPTVGDLRRLLSILSEVSPEYRLHRENCRWFCSVMQESLTNFYSGELRSGTLSHRDLGKQSRRLIACRLLRSV